MKIRLTCVICTRNREKFLDKCIQSLLNQTAADSYEILIVDNGSTDNTRAILDKYAGEVNFRSVFEPVAGLSKARNTGWQNAKGKLVGYIDDDATVTDIWVASVFEVLENVSPVPDWVGGPIHLEWQEAGPNWINEELMIPLGFLDWGREARKLGRHERLGGGNSIYLKDKLKELGGFDERLGRDGTSLLSGEETQLQKRIEASGGYLYYHPGIKIYHFVGKERIQPGWFYNRYYWGGVSDYFMSKTLAGVNESEIKSAENQTTDTVFTQCARIIKNLLVSSGIFSAQERTIHSRIYMAYVFGRLSGIYRWYLKKK